jgi:phage/conjugal plasmid C-4 type zinc finger TraR family protein
MSVDLNDEESFFANQEAVNKQLASVREALEKKSQTTICIECGEPIGEARLKAMPSATLCIDCATYLSKYHK